MKKTIYYILLILLLFSDLSSQSFCEYGLKIGITIANQLYDYPNNFLIKDEKYQYRYGINFGLFVELFEFQHFSFLVDLSYNQKGMINEMLFTKLDPSSPLGYTSEKKRIR